MAATCCLASRLSIDASCAAASLRVSMLLLRCALLTSSLTGPHTSLISGSVIETERPRFLGASRASFRFNASRKSTRYCSRARISLPILPSCSRFLPVLPPPSRFPPPPRVRSRSARNDGRRVNILVACPAHPSHSAVPTSAGPRLEARTRPCLIAWVLPAS